MEIDKTKIKRLLECVRDEDLNADEKEFFTHALLARFDYSKQLSLLLNGAEDRLEFNKKVSAAAELARGKGFGFSGHGVVKTIDGRFSDTKKAAIVRKMFEFSTLLKGKLNVQSFITSGTLLGLIREGQFLAHDDDFDMAYISAFMDKKKIIAERSRIFDAVNASQDFEISDRTGGRAAVFVKCDEVEFNFDLFAGYRHKDFFNEFPLKPEEMAFKDISPVKTMKFYGEDIYVPNNPESLLVVNYGEGWKYPDPSFRFKFGEYRNYYNFLIRNEIKAGEAS